MMKPHFRRTADGRTVQVRDGFANAVANLGTGRDKASFGVYLPAFVDPAQLMAAYQTAHLPKLIVDIPAEDAVRKWRAWQADPKQISAIEAEEKRHDLRAKVKAALILARLTGGGAIYIDTGEQNPERELRPEGVKAKGLKGLTVLSTSQVQAGPIVRDIRSRFYGKPEHYTIQGDTSTVRVHASRLAVFIGEPDPDLALSISAGWGQSVLQPMFTVIRRYDATGANVEALVHEAKIDVFRFKGMMNALSAGGDQAEAAFTKRMQAMAVLKGINGAVALDQEDEYQQKSASFSTLPDIIDRFALDVCAAAGIPVTRLFGRSAAGLSGSGDGDERVYYDRIQTMQELEVEPAMAVLDECLIRSALGARPEEVHFNWRPLRQLTEQERAEIFSKTATAARALAGATGGALLPMDALSDALANRLTEDGSLPGLEQAIEEYGTLAEQDDTEAEAALRAQSANDPAQIGAAAAEEVTAEE